jgi:diaminopimelate epimerase
VLIEVGDRVLQAWQNPQSGRCDGCSDVDVRIDMGIPQFDISIDMGGPQFDLSYTQTLRQYIPATFVSIGNPHVVVVCSSENSLCSSENHPTVPSPYDKPPHDNATHGKPIHDEKHDFESPAHILSLANEKFPDGINIEWMRVFDAHNIAIKIYERGVGETFACGTGACAAAVVAISEGYCEPNVAVHMAHGAVQVSYNESIVLTGCVSFVFEGKIDYNAR